ncbi:hypothetical protein [Clostridium tunisiense]|uniref:hypothetical protein n=1 Tax=Clostridium tunisiense TaxID=219748 RepID=UPI000316039B|nr:hypothetical protein [Clostridium tunisiense]
MTYENLMIAYDGIVKVREDDFSKHDFLRGFKGLYKNGNIAIDCNLTLDSERVCVLAEELGHHYTSNGNILDIEDIRNIKQEKRARNWGYEKLVGIVNIINAYNANCTDKYELIEYLNVTEEFLENSINHYKEKYGLYYVIDNYIVYFAPLGVVKLF